MKRFISSGSRRAFTLVELLVVITIIAILIGLGFPATIRAFDLLKRTQTSTMLSNIQIGLNNYMTEYGVWPSIIEEEVPETVDLIYPILVAREQNEEKDNPRKVVCMEFDIKTLRNRSNLSAYIRDMSEADTIVDPWNREYIFMVDINHDNALKVPNIRTEEGFIEVVQKIAVWSTGSDVKNQRKYIGTW